MTTRRDTTASPAGHRTGSARTVSGAPQRISAPAAGPRSEPQGIAGPGPDGSPAATGPHGVPDSTRSTEPVPAGGAAGTAEGTAGRREPYGRGAA